MRTCIAVNSRVGTTVKTANNLKQASLVREHLSRRFQVHLIGEGALVGLLGGLVVTIYRLALSHGEKLLRSLSAAVRGNLFGMIAWFVFLIILCIFVGLLVQWEPDTAGSGIPQVNAEVAGRLNMSWPRVMLAKLAEGSLVSLAGLSLGREGPSVQIGGMAGKAISQLFKLGRGDERLLVTCGAAAGMSAAFHAPLAGVLFALEEIHKQFTPPLIISAMTASVAADYLASEILGVEPVLRLTFAANLPHASYPLVLLTGIVFGVIGALHNRGMFAVQQRLFAKLVATQPYRRFLVAFIAAGIVAFVWPDLMCGGDAIMERIMDPSSLTLVRACGLLLGKYVFTAVCFGAGVPGGTLFPLVVMGSLSGLILALCAATIGVLPPEYVLNFAVLGIAGLFASSVRAPVSAVILAFELTGSLDALLSVSIVAILSYVTANLLHVDPFYEHLFARLIGSTPDDPTVNGEPPAHLLHTYHVGAGSYVEGKRVGEIAWPNGALIVSITRCDATVIPRGKTEIFALDDLLVLMNTSTEDDTDIIFRKICKPLAHSSSG